MSLINTDKAVKADIYTRKETDLNLDIVLKNTDDTAFDTTDYTFEFEVSGLFTLTSGSGLTVNSNTITLDRDLSTFVSDFYYYKFKATLSGSDAEYWLDGDFRIFSDDDVDNTTTSITLQVSTGGNTINLTVDGAAIPELEKFTLANELTFNRNKQSNIQQGGTRAFVLASSGNVNGKQIEARINQASSEPTFSSDYVEIEGGDSFDGTKLLTIWMRYDSERTKADYFFKNLPAVDITAPTISSATVEDSAPTDLVMVFTEVVNITDLTGLSLNFTTGTAKTLQSVAGTGTTTLTFTLSAAIEEGDVFTFEAASGNNIQDDSGNTLAVTSQAVTNNVVDSFDPSTISAEYLWHKFDTATTTRSGSIILTSTDQLTTTSRNFEGDATNGATIETKLTKECAHVSSATDILRSASVIGGGIFDSEFSMFFQYLPEDGQPASLGYVFHEQGLNANHRVFIVLNTDGKLTFTYISSGVQASAKTLNAVFTNGEPSAWTALDFTVSTSQINIYVDGTLQTLDPSFDGDMSSVNMALYNNSLNKQRLGVRSTSNDTDAPGWFRNFILQPVIHSNQNRTDLATL